MTTVQKQIEAIVQILQDREKRDRELLDKLAKLERDAANSTEEAATTAPPRRHDPAAPAFELQGQPKQEGDDLVYRFFGETALRADRRGKPYEGYALCSDGVLRRLTRVGKVVPGEPVPTAVKVGRTTVAGYLALEPAFRPGDPPALKFVVNASSRYKDALPAGTFRGRRREDREAFEGPQPAREQSAATH